MTPMLIAVLLGLSGTFWMGLGAGFYMARRKNEHGYKG